MAENNFQDYDYIAKAIERRTCSEGDYIVNGKVWDDMVLAAWNILRMVDCQTYDVFETVVNGISIVYYAGRDEAWYEDHMWDD